MSVTEAFSVVFRNVVTALTVKINYHAGEYDLRHCYSITYGAGYEQIWSTSFCAHFYSVW